MRAALLLLALVLLLPAAAAAYPDPDRAPRYFDSRCIDAHDRRFVFDHASVLRADHGREIEGAGCDVYQATRAHFVLVTVPDTGGEILENYALHLFERWGVGDRERQDGLMLLYVVNYTVQGGGGAVRVEVGYGLEGVVNARVAMDAVRLMQAAKRQAQDAGEPEAEAVSYALGTGSVVLLNKLVDAHGGDGFPPPEPEGPGPWDYVVVILIVLAIVLVLHVADRAGLGGLVWIGSGGSFGGGGGSGGGGGGFGGGRSGGGGGSGRL